MSQAEVYKFLEENKEWFCAKEISLKLKVNDKVIRRALRLLFQNQEIFKKQSKKTSGHLEYIYKIR